MRVFLWLSAARTGALGCGAIVFDSPSRRDWPMNESDERNPV
jgi:hypothetical protein